MAISHFRKVTLNISVGASKGRLHTGQMTALALTEE